jgi:hypothetical protein
MNSTYRNAIADHGASLITHIGLVDDDGDELSGGSYARIQLTGGTAWTGASGGTIRPGGDLVFNVPASTTVAGWRGFDGSGGGAVNYGGQALTEEPFVEAGEYRLLAASTGILHADPA